MFKLDLEKADEPEIKLPTCDSDGVRNRNKTRLGVTEEELPPLGEGSRKLNVEELILLNCGVGDY